MCVVHSRLIRKCDEPTGLLATSGGRFVVMRDGKAVLHNPSTRRSFAIHDDSSDKARCISLHPSGDLVAIGKNPAH